MIRQNDSESAGHDANHARANPNAESPENDRIQADAGGTVLREEGGKNQPRERHGRVFLGGILIFGLLFGGGIYYWLSTRNIESTSDAYTDGRAVTIAPQVSGRVVSLDVTDNEFVHKGRALIHIDPRQYENDRDSAQGALDMAQHPLSRRKTRPAISLYPLHLKSWQEGVSNAA